ncbi:MAG: glycosyltransferase family 2 protein [Acidobacteria bacterium]|nr:glycosyltransferase family 2 protein [Acidobacteriota bacterium]
MSVVIPTILGNVHLPTCLEALAKQDYPSDRVEVIVIDNGASTDLSALVRRHHDRARVVRPGRNLGFAAANNAGVATSTGAFVAFLNDDTRPQTAWLPAMIDVARRRRAACVAAYVVDWEGRLVDFAGGLVNFEGKGMQEHVHAAVADLDLAERPVLFANGAAMLVHRETLENAGLWDEGTFAYYEDVELGWRLWMLGHEVWFAPKAIVHHRHHGTSGRWPEAPRVRLLERNALRMVYALLATEHLSGALTGALLLAADRALLQTPFHGRVDAAPVDVRQPRRSFGQRAGDELRLRGVRRNLPLADNLRRIGLRGLAGAAIDTLLPRLRRTVTPASRRAYLIEHEWQDPAFDGRREAIPADAAARLLGIQDFLRELPELSARRRDLQSRRRRSDAEILTRFGDRWLSPVPAANQVLHNERHATLVRVLGLAEVLQAECGVSSEL